MLNLVSTYAHIGTQLLLPLPPSANGTFTLSPSSTASPIFTATRLDNNCCCCCCCCCCCYFNKFLLLPNQQKLTLFIPVFFSVHWLTSLNLKISNFKYWIISENIIGFFNHRFQLTPPSIFISPSSFFSYHIVSVL